MKQSSELSDQVFSIVDDNSFNKAALAVFEHQYHNNELYKEYCNLLKKAPNNINHYYEIPFLPIQFFKEHRVLCGNEFQKTFKSSGTTGQVRSQHFVKELSLYEQSFLKCFEQFYGSVKDLAIIALLPNYLAQGDSSLVYMIDKLIQLSEHNLSGFYDVASIQIVIENLESKNQKALLIGVSYALLDLIEKQQFDLKSIIVMETGGMKGRKKELTREELHKALCDGFGVQNIHSEYGMTELLSQAYSKGKGIYKSPNWMKVLVRDPQDPLTLLATHKMGGVNIIDLANLYSCSFISTQDLGKVSDDGSFEILGRFDNSDLRGCNLLAF